MQENQPNYEGDHRDQPDNALTYQQALELLPAFVLGALDAEEMLAVESYIDQQQSLFDRVAELEATAAQLAYVAPPVALPVHIKAQLLRHAQADLATQERPALAPPVLFPPRKKIAPMLLTPPELAHLRPPQRNWFGGLARGMLGFGVAAALLLLAFMTSQLRGTVGRLSAELNTARSQLTSIQTVNQALQEELQAQQVRVAVLSNPTRQVALDSKVQPNATATFYVHNDIGVLVAHNLQPLPQTQTYQLWLIGADGVPLPSGLMPIHNQELGLLTITIPAAGIDFVNVGVTIEPAEGSDTPTVPIILSG